MAYPEHHLCSTADQSTTSKRRANFSAITSEAARRQLMAPRVGGVFWPCRKVSPREWRGVSE